MSDPPGQPANSLRHHPARRILCATSNPVRWYLLRELASGEQFMVTELAERIGQSPDATSKNMAVLRSAGIVIQGRNRLYSLAPPFIADKTERVLDVGYCLLRMNVGDASS